MNNIDTYTQNMNNTVKTLEFDSILSLLDIYAVTEYGRTKIAELSPILDESKLRHALRETDAARKIVDYAGTPQLPMVDEIAEMTVVADKEGILYPEQLEKAKGFALSCRRLKAYLKKAEDTNETLAFSGQLLNTMDEFVSEVNRCICGDDVDTNASAELQRLRRRISDAEQQIKAKLNELLKQKKSCMADSFVSAKDGHYTLPVKKEYKNQIAGSVIAVSTTGSTCFIEPAAVIKLTAEVDGLRTEELIEKNRILYELTALFSSYGSEIRQNIEIIEKLDFAFAKGRLSVEMDAVSPSINTDRHISITKGRHPLISKDVCVPLDFKLGYDYRGIVITGPNTGGKTVSLKTVGLFSLMAQSGLHLPCESADICMNANVLCDIGDGQNISQSLSTFSAHITNVIAILHSTGRESLILLDELGSGTDPEEGMGLAVAILEELRLRNCLFVATTHYAEVKTYAEQAAYLTNARMTFDKETLRPQYKLIIGEAGESCAFYIAQRLGLADNILDLAKKQLRHGRSSDGYRFVDGGFKPSSAESIPHIRKSERIKKQSEHALSFAMGDSVTVSPDNAVGIVYKPADDKGEVIVQIKGVKHRINHKRLTLKNSAAELYPPDYDFSIIFDSVENRKARHRMDRKFCEDAEITYEEY